MANGLPTAWKPTGIFEVAENTPPVLVNVAGAGALQVVVAVAVPPAFSDVRAASTSALKSPPRSAAVGTHCVTIWPRRSRFHSSFHQKNSLFLITGPPMKYPQSLR